MKNPLPDIERAFGKIALLTETVEALSAEITQLREAREHDAQRIQFLTSQVEGLSQPRELLTEKETAELLSVHIQSLKRWRQEKTPRIPFIRMEGGDVRYRVEEIESYLKSRERGNAKGVSLRAA